MRRVEKNKQLMRDIFAGNTQACGFICRPPQISVAEVGDYTLSREPVEKWVPYIVVCLPELMELSSLFGGLGMHCCADAEHQFDSFKKIPNFYAFNRVKSRRGYLPLLDYFIGPQAPVHCLSWVNDDDLKELMTNAPAGTRFIFVKDGVDEDVSAAWLNWARSLSRG